MAEIYGLIDVGIENLVWFNLVARTNQRGIVFCVLLIHLMVGLLIFVVLLLGALVVLLVIVVGFRVRTRNIGQIVGMRHGRNYVLLLYIATQKKKHESKRNQTHHVYTRQQKAEKNVNDHSYLRRPPAASRQRQAIGAERTRCVQAGHALFALVAAIALAAAFTRRAGIAFAALLAARSLLARNAVRALEKRIWREETSLLDVELMPSC